MTIYLVRHAKAGSRKDWNGPDDSRPLSGAGRRQAEAITDLLLGIEASTITRIMASPFVRCHQTVEPLAARLGLSIELTPALAEDATAEAARQVLALACDSDTSTVFCSHGNIVGDLLAEAQHQGVRLEGNRIEKASTWALTIDAGAIVGARYFPPPA